MPRIHPVNISQVPPDIKAAFEKHVKEYTARITNMKATLGHSLVTFEVYMQWYPLYEEVKKILGGRMAYLYAHAISHASNCPLCTTFFRKIIMDAGENPEELQLTSQEQLMLDFGSTIAQQTGQVPDELYHQVEQLYTQPQIVVLVAFAGQMIATNIFNNVLEVEIDEYLYPYTSALTRTV